MNIFHFSPIFKRVLYYCSHIVQAWDYIQFRIVANYFKLIYFRVIWLNNSTGMQHVKMRARYVHIFFLLEIISSVIIVYNELYRFSFSFTIA